MIVLDNLKCEEKDALKEFEMRMRNTLPSEYYEDPSIFYRFLKARDFDQDKAEKMLRKTGGFFHGILILDADEVTFANATCKTSLDFILSLKHVVQDNYPESMKYLYLINAPRYALIMKSFAMSLMSNSTKLKFNVFGRNGWKERLSELVDADVLPAFLGGNRTDADGNPLCKTFITHGGPISPKYFLQDEERYFADRSQVEKILIPPREKRKIHVDVTENGSEIHWRFLVKNNDIKFGLFLETSEDHVKEILPEVKYSTPDGTEEGYYKCPSIGKYIVVFDNPYSRMCSKEVEYCVTIETI